MAAQTYAIKGIPLIPGQKLPTRQEITTWFNNVENQYEVSLFLQALAKFESLDVEYFLSFFQIAGIHCFPLVGWDGVAPTNEPSPDPAPGFCAHNIISFPAWHRPYIILFEQALQSLMKPLIDSWNLSDNDAQPWREAALNFRLPYWDWASKQPYANDFAIPQICTWSRVKVMLPHNQSKIMPNPLAKFSNPSGKSMGDPSMGKNRIADDGNLPWSKCIGTSRYGIFSDQPTSAWDQGVNGWQSANASIAAPPWYAQGGTSSFGDAVSRMLSPNYFTTYEQFSSTEYNNPNKATDFFSIEYIHNLIHNATGGQFLNKKDAQGNPPQPIGLGHMSDVPVAAFDPIFFLHHCNVDRLFAIWQTLNPTMWWSNNTTRKTDPRSTSSLLPFHKDTTGGFWTADHGRDWTQFNFQYEDLIPQPDAINPNGTINQQKYLRDVRNRVNTLYPSTSNIVKATPSLAEPGNQFNDYIINVVYDRYALQGRAYTILFFLGDPPADISDYRHHENYLGQVYTFSAPIEVDGAVACQNCMKQQGEKILSTAHIPITVPLIYKATRQSQWHEAGARGQAPLGIPDAITGPLEPEIVGRIAENSLQMVFVELGGEVHEASAFPDTEVAVMHGRGEHAAEADGLPNYGGYKVLYKVMLDAGGDHWARLGQGATERGVIQNDPDTGY